MGVCMVVCMYACMLGCMHNYKHGCMYGHTVAYICKYVCMHVIDLSTHQGPDPIPVHAAALAQHHQLSGFGYPPCPLSRVVAYECAQG
jgi:hypothetical protein